MQLIAGDVLDLAELTQSHPETSLVLGPGKWFSIVFYCLFHGVYFDYKLIILY